MLESEISGIKNYLQANTKKNLYPARIKTVLCTNSKFKRSDCLNRGIDSLNSEKELFFICDVDLYLNETIFERIRLFTDNNTAFYPTFFRYAFEYYLAILNLISQ